MMFQSLVSSSNIEKGLFVMVAGIAGVFLVLIVFFFMIKLLQKLFPEENVKK